MEFEDQDQEHEEAEEEMGIPVPPPSYDTGRSKTGAPFGTDGVASGLTGGRKGGPTGTVKYRECQKNHAVNIGGHAVDGCGEFLAAGEEGTLDALKCAACNCHRNFHRKEIEGEMSSFHLPQPQHHQYPHQFPTYYRGPPPPGAGYLHHHLTNPAMAHQRPLALPAAASGGGLSREEEDMSNPSSSGGGGGFGGGGSGSERKKRFRTKFTQEQKEKMLAFSEKVGWRIQKHDEEAVEQFCAETGVKRQVLKVWMHNNKNTLGKKP